MTVKGADWKWLPEHEKAFDNLKSLLTSPLALCYYDVHLSVVLQCDASDTGLGAVLLQEGLSVIYSSRALTATERNYAQRSNFSQWYLLLSKSRVTTSPWRQFSPYHYTARQNVFSVCCCGYKAMTSMCPITEMHIADMLSRAYLEGKPSVCARQLQHVEPTDELSVSPERLEAIKSATASDPVLQSLCKVVKSMVPHS